jgi:hypothetical protein
MAREIHEDNLFQLAFSKELSDFAEACLGRQFHDTQEIKMFLWTYFFNVRIYTSESV